ncbi:hypothetical protein E8K88_17355 [Lampropedia aestuarii]|uniref:Uncharacterized protein n=1 Tax=Lampropedia aestuarii TaxID=2562762 RepID=A0A4S5BM02_9BURK|nr:hypothetical protein [Lampropedia aestuarii]THJ30738.1 hypothetical protein E8K88_17355 [Lampropedia aestuarii]
MNWRTNTLGVILFLTNTVALAEVIPYPSIFSEAPVKRFQPNENFRFNLIERELRNLIAFAGDPKIINNFCASGFKFSNGDLISTVIWENRGHFYFWMGSIEEYSRKESLTLAMSKYANLNNAVDDGEVLSGPRTVNKSQAKSAIEDCEKYGQKFIVPPFTPEPEKSDDDLEEELEYIDESDKGKD